MLSGRKQREVQEVEWVEGNLHEKEQPKKRKRKRDHQNKSDTRTYYCIESPEGANVLLIQSVINPSGDP